MAYKGGMDSVKSSHIRRMFASIAQNYDLANAMLSFGIHFLWRKRLLAQMAMRLGETSGCRVADLCTGSGGLLPGLSRLARHVVGVDFCAPMLKRAQTVRKSNISLVLGDVLDLPLADHSCDGVSVAYGVRNFVDTQRGLVEIARVLRPGGTVFVLEFGTPPTTLFGRIFSWYSVRILPTLGGLLSGDFSAYRYLSLTSGAFPAGEDFSRILLNSGFSNPRYTVLSGGIAYLYEADRK